MNGSTSFSDSLYLALLFCTNVDILLEIILFAFVNVASNTFVFEKEKNLVCVLT